MLKGLVFREFLEMVDQTISPEVTEKIISSCDLPSNGVYTSVGTYDLSGNIPAFFYS